MGDVALEVPLRALALGRRAERHGADHARVGLLGDALDRAALAGRVAALEEHDHLQALVDDPLLQAHELDLQALELLLVAALAQPPRLERPGRRRAGAVSMPGSTFAIVATVTHQHGGRARKPAIVIVLTTVPPRWSARRCLRGDRHTRRRRVRRPLTATSTSVPRPRASGHAARRPADWIARKGLTTVDELRGMLLAATRPSASVPFASSQCARPTAARTVRGHGRDTDGGAGRATRPRRPAAPERLVARRQSTPQAAQVRRHAEAAQLIEVGAGTWFAPFLLGMPRRAASHDFSGLCGSTPGLRRRSST